MLIHAPTPVIRLASSWRRVKERRSMKLYWMCCGVLASITQGCAKKPEIYPMSAFHVDYRTWNCRQLADEADLLHDALAVASEQQSDEKVVHLRAETDAVRRARTLKKCNG